MGKDRIEAVSIREETRQDISEKTLVVQQKISNFSHSGAQDVLQHKMSNCSQSGADLFADSRDGSVRRDSLRSVRTTTTASRDEEREEERIDGLSRVMPSMPACQLGPERGQGRSST